MTSLIYVSPSLREKSTMEQARKNFLSPAHRLLLKLAGRSAKPAIGTWEDGAEESVMTRGTRRLAAALGKKFRQKQVAIFTPDPKGPNTLHVVLMKGETPETADQILKSAGIPYATHFDGHSHVIGASDSQIQATGKPFKTLKGYVEFPGAETREEAIQHYEQILSGQR